MFNESEKRWMDEHQKLIESNDYDKLWTEAEKVNKNFASRLFLGIFYLNSPKKFVIKIQYSNPMERPRVFIFHPDYQYLNFIFTRISNSDVYQSPDKEETVVAKNKILRLLIEGGTPERIAKDLVMNKCELQVTK